MACKTRTLGALAADLSRFLRNWPAPEDGSLVRRNQKDPWAPRRPSARDRCRFRLPVHVHAVRERRLNSAVSSPHAAEGVRTLVSHLVRCVSTASPHAPHAAQFLPFAVHSGLPRV